MRRDGLSGRHNNNIPENQKVNLPVYEQALKALKEKS
jgi:hypothetical protein